MSGTEKEDIQTSTYTQQGTTCLLRILTITKTVPDLCVVHLIISDHTDHTGTCIWTVDG